MNAGAPDAVAPAPAIDGSPSRERILDAAEGLMADHGYAATSISAICRESGLPVGSVYHHFGNKAGVLRAAMERAGERFHAAFRAVEDPNDGPERRLERLYAAAPDILLRNAHYLRILNATDGGPAEDLLHHAARTNTVIATVIADAIRPVAARAGAPDPAALAARLAKLTLVYSRGAMLECEDDLQRLRESIGLLAETVQAAISAARAEVRFTEAGTSSPTSAAATSVAAMIRKPVT